MKRWLALKRWRLLWTLVAAAVARIILAIAFSLAGSQAVMPNSARLAISTLFDIALLALAVTVIIAFVQYGRLYNARIPTE